MATKLTLKDWIFATRPWSFPASAMPAVVALLYVWQTNGESHQNWYLGILAVLGAITLHAGGNMISDYHDFKRGVDREGVPGTDNLTSGRFSPKQILAFGLSLVALSTALGVFLMWQTGFELFWIGLVGAIAALFYYQFKFKALGDLLIFVVYGPSIMMGAGFVMTGTIDWTLALISLPIAFITVNILHSNNTRDIESDGEANIKTFAMLIGEKASIFQYVLLSTLTYVSIVVMAIAGILPMVVLVTLLTIPLAIKNCKAMMGIPQKGKSEISLLDVGTAQLQLAFSGLFSLALLIAGFLW